MNNWLSSMTLFHDCKLKYHFLTRSSSIHRGTRKRHRITGNLVSLTSWNPNPNPNRVCDSFLQYICFDAVPHLQNKLHVLRFSVLFHLCLVCVSCVSIVTLAAIFEFLWGFAVLPCFQIFVCLRNFCLASLSDPWLRPCQRIRSLKRDHKGEGA